MSINRVNWLNVGLMIAACAAALLAPFRLFLVAYAVLGPLHYLTEISWLHDRDYFSPRRPLRRWWLALVLAAIVAVMIGYVGSELLHRPISPTLEMGLVALVFITAGAAVFATHRLSAVAITLLGAVIVAAVANQPRFAIAAYLLVTMVHVLLFTGCFILFGAMKSKSVSGYVSFGVFLLCIAVTLLAAPARSMDGAALASYGAFEQLNRVLLHIIGQNGVALDGDAGRRVMQLIAFAYTYHYLNWFSKTSVIKWHAIPKMRAVTIGVLWIASVALYAVDYRAAFAVLYMLSVLHVLLEFPLNHFTIAGLFRGFGPIFRFS